ncbi:hypothetical protein COCNU_scaffold006273G000030 [Cocos nucifera]|nr:hypothetical protein [Cocos nucifera]
MDTKAAKMLTKELYIQKRKEKMLGGSSKRVKVSAPNFAAPTTTTAALEIAASTEVALTTEVGTIGVDFMPPTPSRPSSEDQTPKLPAEGEMGEVGSPNARLHQEGVLSGGESIEGLGGSSR